MEYIEEFTLDGKDFIYVDFSGLTSDMGYLARIEMALSVIMNYPLDSLYLIANAANVRFDSNTKKITAKYMTKLKPYIRYAVVIGTDGTKKLMITAAMNLVGVKNIHFAFTREKALEWLLKQG